MTRSSVSLLRLHVMLIIGGLAPAHALAQTIAPNRPIAVRILYDGSGSMYPGYAPPDSPARRTKAELGVAYFHEYPHFQQWLGDFVVSQRAVGAASVGMWTFTSVGAFTRDDIRTVHPEVPIERFDVARAVQSFPPRAGQNTYLTEALETFTRDFTGLVWLITDNIVESSVGQADEGVKRFFRTLNDEPRFRSVHLFKYPFVDEQTGQSAALAVYGILVSGAEPPVATLSHYDQKLRDDLRSLFPGNEHLKLKDLRVDPLVLHAAPTLALIVANAENGLFREGERVQLGLTGEIRSHLTQHSVTSGHYELAVESPFVPEESARRDFGLKELPAQQFDSAGADIGEPIPPKGTRKVEVILRSIGPVSFTPDSVAAWLRMAVSEPTVKYTGTVRMSFTDVGVRLERAQMAGIFGIDKASEIFDFQDVRTLERINPSDVRVSFALKTGAGRSALFVAALAVLLATLILVAWMLSRPEWFRVLISGTPERMIPLRRLGSHAIVHEGQPLGHLERDLLGGYGFSPNRTTAAFEIKPASQPDTWDIRFREGRGCQLSIVPRNARARGQVPKPASPAGAPALRSETPTIRPMPKIDRP